jgi:hypothetical protein
MKHHCGNIPFDWAFTSLGMMKCVCGIGEIVITLKKPKHCEKNCQNTTLSTKSHVDCPKLESVSV